MGIFSAMAGWFKGDPYSVSDEEAKCACGGQCTCGDSSQQELIVTVPVTEEVVEEVQEEVTAVVDDVIEEAEKVVEAVTEEKETLSEEVITAADAAAAVMLEQAKAHTPTTPTDSGEVGSKPNAKRKRKVSKKARKKK